MAIGTGTRTPTTALDSEQIIKQRHNEVVVESQISVANHKGNDWQSICFEIPQNLDIRIGRPRFDGPSDERLFAIADCVGTNGFLESKRQTSPDRADDAGGSCLLAVLDIVDVAVIVGVYVSDGASTGHSGSAVGEQFLPGDEQSGSSRSPDHLVGARKDGVLV
jgi:hypothetical protein